MNLTVDREPADKATDVVDVLLTSKPAAQHRGTAIINHNDSNRKNITAGGPKNQLMWPCKLVEVIKRRSRYRGILTLYSRSYNRDGKMFTINSDVNVEAKIPDTRPKVI